MHGALTAGREYLPNALEFAAGIQTGLLMHLESSTAHLQVKAEEFSNDAWRVNASYTHNFPLARDQSIRLNLNGIRTIQAMVQEDNEIARFAATNQSYADAFYEQARINSAMAKLFKKFPI